MTARRDVFQSWVVDHPVGHDVDLESASYRGSRRFRRWLFLRTVAGILIGAVFVGGMVGLRSAIAGGLSLGARATASLVVRPDSGNVPLRVTLDGSGSAPGRGATMASYDFDFGDGTSTGPQPKATVNHTYKSPGTFTVTLTVTSSAGRTDQTTQDVTVTKTQPGDPTAKLLVTPRTGKAPMRITARASTSSAGKGAKITAYDFDFGDGTSTGPVSKATIKHTYKSPGTFAVTLIVTNSAGRTDQTTQDVTVTKPPPSEPTAELRVNPQSGQAPLQITATGSNSSAGKGAKITSYEFDFGDGTTIGPQPDPTVKHTYKSPDTYKVTLTVTDSTGATSQDSTKVTAEGPPPGKPVARLFVTPSQGEVPLGVSADGSKSSPGGGATITSYKFDFGDGSTEGPQKDPLTRHTYQEADTYTVTLTVTDSTGATSQDSINVTAEGPPPGKPAARLFVTPLQGEVPLGVSADGSKSSAGAGATITSYRFDFKDSVTEGKNSEADHTYNNPKRYTVTLTVTDSTGATSQDSKTVCARPPDAEHFC